MNTKELIAKLQNSPEEVTFNDVMATIEADYIYKPSRFFNGIGNEKLENRAGSNEGSCKIFAFAKTNQLNSNETLHCFGDYYRKDVLQHPSNDDHANIRTFIRCGWEGIEFDGEALEPRS